MNITSIFGLPFAAVRLAEAAEVFADAALRKQTRLIFTANTEHIVLMQSNREFLHSYQRADYIVADGMPLVWFSYLVGHPLPERVTGSDLLPAICRIAEKKKLRVFFLGGTPEVTQKAIESLLLSFPNLQIAGSATPWINLDDTGVIYQELIDSINRSESDIVFIGLGAPKQEIWAERNRKNLKTGIVLTVGGTFNFLAGTIIRAPRWMQKSGLEWLWRLFHEPKRLWKRYLIGNAVFLRIAWKEWLGEKEK